MSASIHFEFDTKELERLKRDTLRRLGTGTAEAVRSGLKRGADYARDNHPHTQRTGRLTSRDELQGVIKSADERGAWGYLQNTTPYARFVEYGTKPHEIKPLDYHWESNRPQRPTSRVTGRRVSVQKGAGRGQALRFYVGGKVVFARHVDHPGTQPMPFMDPAARFARSVITIEVWKLINQTAKLWD